MPDDLSVAPFVMTSSERTSGSLKPGETAAHGILGAEGLQRSPRIITDPDAMFRPGVLTAADVSCLVIPDGCLGLPTLAALEQSIPVIAVRENKNLMNNDLAGLPWRPGQFVCVENYWEATGVVAAMRAGLDPASVRRPLQATTLERKEFVPGAAPRAADSSETG